MTQSEAATISSAFPIAMLDLVEEARKMRDSPRPGGHLGKTLLHEPHLRLVLMILDKGVRIPPHQAKGSLTVQVLDGRVVIGALDSSFELGADHVLALGGDVTHSLVAIEDTALLLTIAH